MVKWYVDQDFASSSSNLKETVKPSKKKRFFRRKKTRPKNIEEIKGNCETTRVYMSEKANNAAATGTSRSSSEMSFVSWEHEKTVSDLSFRIEDITSEAENNLALIEMRDHDKNLSILPSSCLKLSGVDPCMSTFSLKELEENKPSFPILKSADENKESQLAPPDMSQNFRAVNTMEEEASVAVRADVRRSAGSGAVHDPAKRRAVVDLLDFDINEILDGITDGYSYSTFPKKKDDALSSSLRDSDEIVENESVKIEGIQTDSLIGSEFLTENESLTVSSFKENNQNNQDLLLTKSVPETEFFPRKLSENCTLNTPNEMSCSNHSKSTPQVKKAVDDDYCHPVKPLTQISLRPPDTSSLKYCQAYSIAKIPIFPPTAPRIDDGQNTSWQNRNFLLANLLRSLSNEAWQLESTAIYNTSKVRGLHIDEEFPRECQVESKSLIEILESTLNVPPDDYRTRCSEITRGVPPKQRRLTAVDYGKLKAGHFGRKWKNVNCMARALYSNTAESPDELEFRKDDLLTVLEQNTAGLEGWWLCSLRGRQGICPGNRLRIIPGCYDTGSGVPTTLARPHTSPALHGAPASSTTMPRSTGNKVVTPKRVGDTYTYDTPRRHVGSSPAPPLAHYPTLDYDVPRGPPVMNNDGPRLSRSSSLRYEAPRHIPRGSYELHDIPTSPYDQQTSMHYDIPRPQTSTAQSALYDSPRPQVATGAVDQRTGVATRSLIKGVRGPAPAMSSATPVKLPESDSGQYDVPKPLHEAVQLEVPNASDRSSGVSIMSCDSTSSSASSVPASESPYLSSIGGSSNRSSLEVQDVYDVPPEPRKVGTVQKPRLPPRECATRPQNEALADKNSVKSEGVYDVPPQVSRDARSSDAVDAKQSRVAADLESVCDNVLTGAGLPLEYDSAIDMLSKLQQDVHVSLEKLANFNVVVSPIKKPVSIERFNESKIIIDRLKDTLQEFIRFTKGAAVNSYKAGFERLASTLQQQAERLVSTYDIIKNTWNCAQHNREEALDVVLQLTSITKPLAEDVRHLANIIQINAPQIFKKTPSGEQVKQKFDTKPSMHETPTRDGPAENMYANESAILEDYDYVKLESRETADREHQQIKESLPANLRKSYDNLVKQSHSVVDNDHQKALPTSSSTVTSKNLNSGTAATKTCRLDANDRQVLAFYSNQAEQHIQHLNTAIDAFFLTIEENQPPKVFIAHSKFVILSAHKLVFIGDTVHRNVVNSEVRSCVLNCSNALCDAMKNTVAAAKNAAIKFPSVAAVQAMVDSFTTISNLACNLRNAICRN